MGIHTGFGVETGTLEISTANGVSLGEWNINVAPAISCTTVACSKPPVKCFKMVDIFNIPRIVPEITRVIFSEPATIVFWADGDKTIVKSDEVDGYWEHIGLASAVVKKAFGGRSKWLRHFKDMKKELNKLPFTDDVNKIMFDEFDLALHYMDKLYGENNFCKMLDRFMKRNEK